MRRISKIFCSYVSIETIKVKKIRFFSNCYLLKFLETKLQNILLIRRIRSWSDSLTLV